MDFKLLLTVFSTVFAAEIADKTQVATFLYASNAAHAKMTVFIGSALALVVASGPAVFFGVSCPSGSMKRSWQKSPGRPSSPSASGLF